MPLQAASSLAGRFADMSALEWVIFLVFLLVTYMFCVWFGRRTGMRFPSLFF